MHDTEITYNGQRLYPGVWMHYSTRTEEGEETARHEWQCGPLHVDAITRNSTCSEGYGRLLRFTNLDPVQSGAGRYSVPCLGSLDPL